jgi:hypothetical protein
MIIIFSHPLDFSWPVYRKARKMADPNKQIPVASVIVKTVWH